MGELINYFLTMALYDTVHTVTWFNFITQISTRNKDDPYPWLKFYSAVQKLLKIYIIHDCPINKSGTIVHC